MKEKNLKKILKQKNGITLIALVTTIIVLLILAGITIGAITGSNGIIGQAQSAKEETEISQEKEIIDISTVEAMGKNNRGNLEEEEFQTALSNHTNGKASVLDTGEEFEVLFEESNRYYIVDKNGNIGEMNEYIEDDSPGDITKDENGKELAGTADEPYQIWCIEDLVAFSNITRGEGIVLKNGNPEKANIESFSGKYVVLKRTLNFNSKLSYQNSERTDFGDINGNDEDGNTLINEMLTGTGFNPIGVFCGTFDGENHEIINLYENRTSGNLGLFGEVKNSTIKNLTVQGKIEVSDENNTGVNGGIVALSRDNSTFINCSNKVEINSQGVRYATGGIVGRSWGNAIITNCSNFGRLSSTSEATGGIIGRSENDVNIKNCFNVGEIGSTGSMAGGIAGDIIRGGKIINVYNSGEISENGPYGRGGIAGRIGLGGNQTIINISNAYNIGNVIENNIVWNYGAGGIVGYIMGEDVTLNLSKSYYLSGTCSVALGNDDDSKYGVTKLETLSNEELKNNLNSYVEENENQTELKKWKLSEEGYPIFE